MNNDLTKEFPQSADEKLTLILTTVLSTSVRVDNIDMRLQRVEEGQRTLEEGQRTLEQGQRVLKEGVVRLEEGQAILCYELEKLKHSVAHRFLVFSGQAESRYRDLDKRVTILEARSDLSNSQT